MTELDKAKLKTGIAKANACLVENEMRKLERLEDIKRIDEHSKLQQQRISELEQKLKGGPNG